MEMTNPEVDQSTEPTIDPLGEATAGAGAANGGSASDIYDADRPPFEERPEKPKARPAAVAAPVDEAGSPVSPEMVRAAAAVVVGLVALLFVRRRRHRRRGRGHVSRRARRAQPR